MKIFHYPHIDTPSGSFPDLLRELILRKWYPYPFAVFFTKTSIRSRNVGFFLNELKINR